MVEKILCPQCKTENDSSASQCIKCGFNFISNSLDSSSESDWLSFLRGAEGSDQTTESPLAGNAENQSEPFAEDNEDSPDWLKRIRDIKQTDSEYNKLESRKSMESHSSSENDDLIKSLRDEDNQPKEETVDWISDFRNTQKPIDEESPLANDQDEIPEESASNTSSTLEEIKKNWQIEFPSALDADDNGNILPAEEFPDWLSKNISKLSEKDEIQEDSDIPDWLSPVSDETSETDDKSKEPFDIPDWLSKTNFLGGEEPKQESEPGSSTESDELLQFLKEINPLKAEPAADLSISADDTEMDIEETYDSVLLFNKLDMLPDTTNDVDSKPEVREAIGSELDQDDSEIDQKRSEESAFIFDENELESYSVSPFIGLDENEDWLQGTQLSVPDDDLLITEDQDQDQEGIPEESNEPFSAFKIGEVPDWLENIGVESKEVPPFQEMEEEKASYSSEGTNIERGNLPDWLKAIRPIEAVTPELPKQKYQSSIEKSGPLAGFQGVLSSENVAKTFSAPPAYSATINITDKQKMHLKILEEVISPTLSSTATKKKQQSLLYRLEIYLVPFFLLLIIVYSSFIDHSSLNFPENLPADAVRFHTLATGYLNRSQSPSHVLVIFETDGSSYPELNLISEGFFEDLFNNNHWVTTISTNPNGFLVAGKILSNVYPKVPAYNHEERVTNLGYLPGYGPGIQAFLLNPRATSPGMDLNLQLWKKVPLSEIDSANDFDMIVLVTDNSENAKLWIEQINLLVEKSDLLLISTTKAAPLMQPYLRTNQVDGMLSGMMGGLAFNLLSKTNTNDIGRYWAIVQLAAMVFVFFLLAGGVISIFNKALGSENSEKNK